MPISLELENIDWKFKWIFWAQVFLFLGVLSSPTVVSLFHIIIIIPTLVLWYKNPKRHLSKSSWLLLGMCAWGLIATLYNIDTVIKPRKSFGELKYYLLGVLLIVPLQHFYLLAPKSKIKTLLNIFWVVVLLAFAVGASRAYLGFDPVKMKFTTDFEKHRMGGFLNYMRYGYASAFVVILGISGFLNLKEIKNYISKPLFFPAVIISAVAIITTKTRGALLALLVGAPFILIKYRPKIAYTIFAVGAIFVSFVLYSSLSGKFTTGSRFFNINDNSNKMRTSQWYSAVKITQEKPIFGLGADQFSYNVKKIKEKYDIWSKHYTGHAHNIFLEHFANYGIPGGLIIMAFFIFWFIEMIKLKTAMGWAVASYIFAFVISGQVELLFDNANSHILFYIYSFSQIPKDPFE